MKRTTMFCVCLILVSLFLVGCWDKNEYTPTGDFYIKTSPCHGDAGVEDVISLEADHKTYEGDGDITVSMTVGLGHLPGASGGYGDGVRDTFYAVYKIVEAPWVGEKDAAWEKKVEYTESWYDSKYNSTEQKNRSFLFIAFYGQFYPLYKETVEIVFPAGVENGYFQVELYAVVEGREDWRFADLEFTFDRIDGTLRLDPSVVY